MSIIKLREPISQDKDKFIKAMQRSTALHSPWVMAPQTPKDFDQYLARTAQSNQKSFLLIDHEDNILGVFNINEIVRGFFQSAYLGFYGVSGYEGKGYMSAGLKLVLQHVFKEFDLHRLEANIQPENFSSIRLVKNNGFRQEGYSPRYLNIGGEWRDHERWAITNEDYMSNLLTVSS
jgi:RimJ/RimL family protein N-acetyltransferase